MVSASRQKRSPAGDDPDEDHQENTSPTSTPSLKRSRTSERTQAARKPKVIFKNKDQDSSEQLLVISRLASEGTIEASSAAHAMSSKCDDEVNLDASEAAPVAAEDDACRDCMQDTILATPATGSETQQRPAEMPAYSEETNDNATDRNPNADDRLAEFMRKVVADEMQKMHRALTEGLAKQNMADKARLSELESKILTESKNSQRLAHQLGVLTCQIKDQPAGYREFKVTDNMISEHWAQISHHINTISAKMAEWVARSPSLSIEAQNVGFPALIGQILESSSSFQRCHALLQNWAWRWVVKSILESSEGPWEAPVGQAFVAYYHSLLGLMQKGEVAAAFVSQIKCANACQIEHLQSPRRRKQQQPPPEKLERPGESRQKTKQGRMLRSLMQLCHVSNGERDQINHEITKVVSNACWLEKTMLTSKAIFRIGSLEPYISTALETSCNGKEERAAIREECHIVTSPSLEKRGTADGEDFDQTTPLQFQTTRTYWR